MKRNYWFCLPILLSPPLPNKDIFSKRSITSITATTFLMVCLQRTKLGDNPRLWYPEKDVWGEETIPDLCSQRFCLMLFHEVGMGHFVTIFVASFQRSSPHGKNLSPVKSYCFSLWHLQFKWGKEKEREMSAPANLTYKNTFLAFWKLAPWISSMTHSKQFITWNLWEIETQSYAFWVSGNIMN